jgi:hypothetical protein
MPSSSEYKRQIMNDLAQGSTETLDERSENIAQKYSNFDDFAQRSSKDERRHIFGRNLHPDRIPPSQMEPELRKAIEHIKPNERDDVARAMFKQLHDRGFKDRDLAKQLSLSTHHPSRMSADDVTKLASYTYHNHPDIFQDVMAEQPAIMKFFSNPIVGAVVGAIAAKWLGNRS